MEVVNEDDEVNPDEGSSVDPLPSSRINILLIGANAKVIGLSLREPKIKDLEDKNHNYDIFHNLVTFSCKGYIYHLTYLSIVFSSVLNTTNILKAADQYLTDALFVSNTIILVLSAKVGDAVKNQNSVERLVDCANHFGHFIRFIILVNKMDLSITENNPNWEEARFNDVRTEAIAAAPLLSQLPVTWIPVDVTRVQEENIHMRSGKCPWFEGNTLAECLRQLAEQRLQQQVDVQPNQHCRFSIYESERVGGLPNIFRVTGQQISGSMVKMQIYNLLPNDVTVKVVNINSAGNSIERTKTGDILVLLLYIENPLREIRNGAAICSTDVTTYFSKRIRTRIDLVDDFDVFSWPITVQFNGFQTPAYILDMKLENGEEISTPLAGTRVRATIAFKAFHLDGTSGPRGRFVIKTGRYEKVVKGIGRITRVDASWHLGGPLAARLWKHNNSLVKGFEFIISHGITYPNW